jgi:cell division septum initiation protein DivIVA
MTLDSQDLLIVSGAAALVFGALIVFLLLSRKKLNRLRDERSQLTFELTTAEAELGNLRTKYKDVIDIDSVVQTRQKQLAELESQYNSLEQDFNTKRADLNGKYQQMKAVFDDLQAQLAILEEDLEFTSYGLYKPHYDFDTSEKYKERLDLIRQEQKALVKEKSAAVCHGEWTVEGSRTKGKKMTNQYLRLMLRAFNNECDAAVLKVRWNNVDRMEARIEKAFEIINKLGTVYQIDITHDYLRLKLEELHLTHEYAQKRQDEKEEQRRIKQEMREEDKAQRELEKAQKEAEEEEKRFTKALEKARAEMSAVTGEELESLNSQIAALEQQLAQAHEQKERAVSRAQLTKSGHVYVISNIGSFGTEVFKIGMTRRLEPLDRVKELGDASVPFSFDVHAMIYSDNAPELENKLHKEFDERRINRVNSRKEFFRVSLAEVEKVVKENHGEITFTKLAEAQEYRETLALIKSLQAAAQEAAEAADSKKVFPDSLG